MTQNMAKLTSMTMQQLGATGIIPVWTLSDRLRKARETTGLDQAAFAERTGLSRNTVSNYENGHTTPRRSNVMMWAMATGVPAGWLLNGETPPSDEDEGDSDSVRLEGLEPPTF